MRDIDMGWLLLLACGVWVGVLAWWFWEYVDALTHRQPDETWREALERGGQERVLNQQARAEMFGTRRTTRLASIASKTVSVFTVLSALQGRWVGLALAAFVAVGLVLHTRMNMKEHPSWPRLNGMDRLWFRLTHAWLWPLHLVAGGGIETNERKGADE